MLLNSIILATVKTLGATHFIRPAGSYIEGQSRDGSDENGGEAIAAWLADRCWENVTNDIDESARFGECQYYRAEIPSDCAAFQAAVHVDTLSDDDLTHVRVQRGHHGNIEMVAPTIEPRPVNYMHLCVGENEGSLVVFFWAPGDVLPPGQTVKLG